jgi:hypothetical protein
VGLKQSPSSQEAAILLTEIERYWAKAGTANKATLVELPDLPAEICRDKLEKHLPRSGILG